MPRNLDLALLRSFVVAADRASMTAAANALHLTQGAVSGQIRRLEELCGGPLFERGARGLRLTGAGEHLLGKARRLVGLNDELWAEITAAERGSELRLGIPPDLVGGCVAPALKAYAEACPRVEVRLRCAPSPELAGALARGELDMAVIEEPSGASGGECLRVERLVWVGAPGGGAHRRRPLPVSIADPGCAFCPAVLAALRGQGREWRPVFGEGGLEATAAAARTDLAVAPWLETTVPPGLEILPVAAGLPGLPRFSVSLHRPADDGRAATAELARQLRRGFAGPA